MRCCRPFILVAVTAVSLLAVGCGSNSSSASNSAGEPTEAQFQRDGLRFADCMRSHGAPAFPDPGSRGFKAVFANQSPVFWSTVKNCQHLAPGIAPSGPSQSAPPSQAQAGALLAFAHCMRSYGFPSFPDPTSSGQLTHEMLANAGIDLRQPAVLQAGDACVGVTHGVITKAIVANFVSGH